MPIVIFTLMQHNGYNNLSHWSKIHQSARSSQT